MKKSAFFLILLIFSINSRGQSTFKGGWNTYTVGTITHEYTYSYTFKDSARLYITDSCKILTSTDSLTTMTLSYPNHDKSVYKTINYLNAKKLLIKTEDYKDDNLQVMKEWRYDSKNRKEYSNEDNKTNGNVYKKYYEYSTNKKNGDQITTETAYFNGRIEFYTKTYIDKKNVKYKEIRLNDNNKDVVHVETFIYGPGGKLKERSVFFPEWKVTRKFPEKEEITNVKCLRVLPVGIPDKVTLHTRIAYMKKVLAKNQPVLSDKECPQYYYTFKNFSNCEMVVATTNVNNGKKVIFRFKENLPKP